MTLDASLSESLASFASSNHVVFLLEYTDAKNGVRKSLTFKLNLCQLWHVLHQINLVSIN